MSAPEKKEPEESPSVPPDPQPVQDAVRNIKRANEDLDPAANANAEGPGHASEGAGADTHATTTHSGQTTRGSYSTDSSTGAGRYMDHSSGTFGVEPVDEEGKDDAIDTKL